MSSRTLTLGTSGIVTLALVVAAWIFLAPTQLGGSTSYAVVSGNSMEPMLHRGDLVVTRKRDEYGKGDVVLYDSVALDAHVLHRIVAAEGGAFVTKGDNNGFLDSDRPVPAQVRGELWFTLGGVGSFFTWLQQPVHLGVAGFLLALLVLGGGHQVVRRRGAGVQRPVVVIDDARRRAEAAQMERGLLTAGLTALALFVALGVMAWTKPESTTSAVSGAYAHTGELTYAASPGKSAVYPAGQVTTGDSVFTRLVKKVELTFAYVLERGAADVTGEIALDAVVDDGSGWSRTLPLAAARPFEGPEAEVTGRLSLAELQAVTERMRSLTGASATSFTVTVKPLVRVAGTAGGATVDEDFRPEVPFSLDPVALRVRTAAELGPSGAEARDAAGAALTARKEGAAAATQPTRVGVGRFTVGTVEARALASTGILLSGLVSALAALLLARRRQAGEADRIAARFGSRIVRVETVIPEGRWVTDLPDIESLVQVADRYDRMILHSVGGGVHTYLVDDGVAVYRFRVADGAVASRKAAAAGA